MQANMLASRLKMFTSLILTIVGQAPLRILTGEIPEQLTAKQRFRYVFPFTPHTGCLGSEKHREQAVVLLLQSRSVQYKRPNWQKHLWI